MDLDECDMVEIVACLLIVVRQEREREKKRSNSKRMRALLQTTVDFFIFFGSRVCCIIVRCFGGEARLVDGEASDMSSSKIPVVFLRIT